MTEPPQSPLDEPLTEVQVLRAAVARVRWLREHPTRYDHSVGDGWAIAYVRADDVLHRLADVERIICERESRAPSAPRATEDEEV